jgi:hypothetical protein
VLVRVQAAWAWTLARAERAPLAAWDSIFGDLPPLPYVMLFDWISASWCAATAASGAGRRRAIYIWRMQYCTSHTPLLYRGELELEGLEVDVVEVRSQRPSFCIFSRPRRSSAAQAVPSAFGSNGRN